MKANTLMKLFFMTCIAGLLAITAIAQKPVTWNYSIKKISDNIYELHLKASIQKGWHVYAQKQPENFIGKATTITFNQHALLKFEGEIKELGQLKKKYEPELDIECWQYNTEVEFVQRVILKNKIKTNVGGNIEFQACTDELCLQPSTVSFNFELN